MLPEKVLKIRCSEMLFSAISDDITVKKFRSLHSIFIRLQYRWKHIHLLFMILLAISRYS